MFQSRNVVTVDGKAASGKTTLSRRLAQDLGYIHVNTGLLYRAVAFLLQGRNAEVLTAAEVKRAFADFAVEFRSDSRAGSRLFIQGQDATEKLQLPEVSEMTAHYAAKKDVRDALLDLQREAFPAQDLVAEGRDMGTVVFRDAAVKFFIDGNPSILARRRALDIAAAKGIDATSPPFESLVEQTLAALEKRNEIDSSRLVGPLKPAADAILIDNTLGSLEETLAKMKACVVKNKTTKNKTT